MQIIFGIILIGLAIAFVQMYWKFLLIVIVIAVVGSFVAYKMPKAVTEKEKNANVAGWLVFYSLGVFIFFYWFLYGRC